METKIKSFVAERGGQTYQVFPQSGHAHKRCNNIDQLIIQDETVKDPERIKGEIIGFYQKLYSETSYRRPSRNLINCPMVTEAENELLQREFKEQEVLACLKMCAIDKAPGPDGYTMGFFIKCWDVVKKDIMDTF